MQTCLKIQNVSMYVHICIHITLMYALRNCHLKHEFQSYVCVCVCSLYSFMIKGRAKLASPLSSKSVMEYM